MKRILQIGPKDKLEVEHPEWDGAISVLEVAHATASRAIGCPIDLPDSGLLVFVEPVTAESFLCQLAFQGTDRELANDSTVCAIGIPTTEVLRLGGVHCDIYSCPGLPETIAASVFAYMPAPPVDTVVVGGVTDFRLALKAQFDQMEWQSSLWPPEAKAWSDPALDGRLLALVVGGGVDRVRIRSWLDVLTLQIRFGDALFDDPGIVFETDDEICLLGLEELGAVVELKYRR